METIDRLPNPDDVKILYCGNLSPDDFMWSVECTVESLFDMLCAPQAWVDGLGRLPRWSPKAYKGDPPGGAPILTSPFTIQLALYAPGRGAGGKVQIEGISETGIVRVVASEESANHAAASLIDRLVALDPSATAERYLRSVLDRPDVWKPLYWFLFGVVVSTDDVRPDVILDQEDGTWFGHLRIYDRAWNRVSGLREPWIALFVLMRLVDPKGYTDCLNTLGLTIRDPLGNALDGQELMIVPSPNVSFSYSSSELSQDEACDALFGPLQGTDDQPMGMLQNAIVKNYRTPVPPPAPHPEGHGR